MEGARPTRLAAAATVDGRPFPLTLAPTACAYPTAHDRTTWLKTSRREVLQLVASHGAVLLRGWGGAAASDFSALVDALGLEDFDASCSAAPRTLVAPRVFTANEAPPEEVIPFHHEMAQAYYGHWRLPGIVPPALVAQPRSQCHLVRSRSAPSGLTTCSSSAKDRPRPAARRQSSRPIS